MSVPYEWTKLIEHQRIARIEQDAIRAPETPQATRDIAIQRYTAAVDVVMACLGTLSENQTLGRITMMLARKDRS